MRVHEFFRKVARQKCKMLADQLAREMRKVVGVQAPTRITRSGRMVAATRATPFAPPRKVTGRLQKSIHVIETKRGASVQVCAPYAQYLEYGTGREGFPHAFLSVAKSNLGMR